MKLVVKFVAVFVATIVAWTGIAHAADLQSEAVLGSTAGTPTEVTVGDNSFQIKVWATGNLGSSRTATVVTVYNMATNGVISPDATHTETLSFPAQNYSQCTSPGCASNPYVVNATLKVATGTPVNRAGTLTVDLAGATNLTVVEGSSEDTGYVRVISSSSTDTTDPSIASFSINDGAAWTNTTAVTTDIGASDDTGLAGYTLSNSPITSTTPAVTPFAATDLAHSLSAGDGIKTVYVRVFDAAGNYADASDTIGLDTVAPTITGSTTPYTLGSWTNQSVVVTFTCADESGGSGIAQNTVAGATLTTSGEDQQVTNTGVCSDAAGNSASSATVTNIDIDKVAPIVSVTGVTQGQKITLGSTQPTIGCTTTDPLSGVLHDAALEITGPTTGVGTFTATCSGAEDNAGNSNSATVNYRVVYNWTGFFQPVDNPTYDSAGALTNYGWNKAKAGSAIPVKFNLGGYQGLEIFDTGYPKAVAVTCPGATTGDTVEELVTASTSGLKYDTDARQYIYVWKTTSTYAGKCYRLDVKLIDGTTHSAYFNLTK